MPPTFLIFLAVGIYAPVFGAFVLISAALLVAPKTRMLGKRLLYATVATVPGLVLAGLIIGVLGVLLLSVLFAVTAGHTTDGTVTSPLVATIAGTVTLITLATMGAVVLSALFGACGLGHGGGSEHVGGHRGSPMA